VQLDSSAFLNLKSTMVILYQDRSDWYSVWRDIANYFLPKRYLWLQSSAERRRYIGINTNIVDATGTNAGKILASGMMNGITSPARPWFKLRLAGFEDDLDYSARVWLDDVERKMLLAMAESNFYNSLAVMYLDLVFFGTASMLIYEDFENIFCCRNPCLGEYYIAQNSKGRVDTFARTFTYTVKQVVQEYGEENCSENVKQAYKRGGAGLQQNVEVNHLVEPNDKRDGSLSPSFNFRETCWESSSQEGQVLSRRGYHELPGIFPRWEVTGNDNYGTSPAFDALGDVKQLQQETIRKAQSLDYMVRPPMLLDVQMKMSPTALVPGGQTFIAGLSNGHVGGKPAYQIQPPINELTLDIRDVQARIRETFHNDLFKMISQLETVRSATEIDARREEKLVLLGPVLERFNNEALDPGITRIFNIMLRAGLLPDPPRSIQNRKLEIQYVSILSAAQSAVGVIPTERFLQVIGNVSSVYPKALNIPNWDELLLDYGRDIGVKAKNMNSREAIAEQAAADDQRAAMASGLEAASVAADAAKNLSATDVGGGANALQRLIG
jgi:hypothetical protein